MDGKLISVLLIGVLGCTVQAFAQENGANSNPSNREAMTSSTMTPLEKHAMKACMSRAMMTADDQMSVGDMRKSCLEQVKVRLPKDQAKMGSPGASAAKPQ